MATPAADVVKVNWKQVCPWIALFRTLGMALHVRQVVIGVIATVLISLGHHLILGSTIQRTFSRDFLDGNLVNWVWAPMVDLAWPLKSASLQVVNDVEGNSLPTAWGIMQIVVLLLWGGIVGGWAGGILSRRAAFEYCREEGLSLTAGLKYVWGRAFDYISAPGLPFAGVLGLGAVLVVAGWLGVVIPGGTYILSAVWAVCFLIGIVMALLSVAILLGWPMMIAAISVNGSDGFDALSRGFGFVLDRWRYYAWCLLIMTVYGSLIFFLIWMLLSASDFLAVNGVALGFGADPINDLPATAPRGLFANAIVLLLTGFAYSFFWANMTVIYIVLRKSVDNAELDAIYIDGGPVEPDDLQALLNPQMASAPTLLPIIDPPTH